MTTQMKNRNRKMDNVFNNKYISQMSKTLRHKNVKKSIPFKKLKNMKSNVAPSNDNMLYTLRNNKVVEKKSNSTNKVSKSKEFSKSILTKRKTLKRPMIIKEKSKEAKKLKRRTSKQENSDSLSKFNSNESLNSQSCSDSKQIAMPISPNNNSLSRSHMDAKSKLMVLDVYHELQSFNRVSELTGVKSQTIRYWKRTEDSIKKKAQLQALRNDSILLLDPDRSPSELRANISKKAAALHNQSDRNSTTSPTRAANSVAECSHKATKSSRTSQREVSLSRNSAGATRKTARHEQTVSTSPTKSETRARGARKTTVDSKQFSMIPDFPSIEAIVEEINKLSSIYESPDNLEYLNNHFKTLLSERASVKSYDNTSLLVKTKMQDESFRHIISDFFQGEYKLLLEIDHQFQQLMQKKSKKVKKNVEELKNYFHGSIQRLHVLKQQLP